MPPFNNIIVGFFQQFFVISWWSTYCQQWRNTDKQLNTFVLTSILSHLQLNYRMKPVTKTYNFSSIEAPSTSYLWGIDGDRDVTGSCITGNDVTGSREPEMKGRSFPAFFPRGFSGTPLESRYENGIVDPTCIESL